MSTGLLLAGCGGSAGDATPTASYRELARSICAEYASLRRRHVRSAHDVSALVGRLVQLEDLAARHRELASLRTCVDSLPLDSENEQVETAAPPPGVTRCFGSRTPSLTRAEYARAVRIVRSDPAITRLLRGTGFSVAHSGPWSTGGVRNCLVGADLWLVLAQPVTIDGRGPVDQYEPRRFPPYVQHSTAFDVPDVEEVLVDVDLVDHRVAGLQAESATHVSVTGGPVSIGLALPAAVRERGRGAVFYFRAGEATAARSGCLACHRIAQAGNDGPGTNLTHIGGRLAPAAIERALVDSPAPMPSFKDLPPSTRRALVDFLSALR